MRLEQKFLEDPAPVGIARDDFDALLENLVVHVQLQGLIVVKLQSPDSIFVEHGLLENQIFIGFRGDDQSGHEFDLALHDLEAGLRQVQASVLEHRYKRLSDVAEGHDAFAEELELAVVLHRAGVVGLDDAGGVSDDLELIKNALAAGRVLGGEVLPLVDIDFQAHHEGLAVAVEGVDGVVM